MRSGKAGEDFVFRFPRKKKDGSEVPVGSSNSSMPEAMQVGKRLERLPCGDFTNPGVCFRTEK